MGTCRRNTSVGALDTNVEGVHRACKQLQRKKAEDKTRSTAKPEERVGSRHEHLGEKALEETLKSWVRIYKTEKRERAVNEFEQVERIKREV